MSPIHAVAAIAWLIMSIAASHAIDGQTRSADQPAPVRIAVTAESNLRSNFIESLKDAAKDNKLSIEIVPHSQPDLTYTIISPAGNHHRQRRGRGYSLGQSGDVAASVVRSGRMSGRGALNACAKELVKS